MFITGPANSQALTKPCAQPEKIIVRWNPSMGV